jgi:hypothetical protein
MTRTTKRDAATLWRAIQEQAIDDDVQEILAMSDEELDRYISENGGDPAAIRAAGAANAKELMERRERLAWHADAHAEQERFRERAAAAKTRTPLPRPELLRRMAAIKTDPRFAHAPVAAFFRKKTAEESTDEELQAILDQIELLAK